MNIFFLLTVFLFVFQIIGTTKPYAEIIIPVESDWEDHGLVLQSGSKGQWDDLLGDAKTGTQGMHTVCALVKKDNTYFLYYLGADGKRVLSDGGVRHRAMGVATSKDGINFTKYSGNPILTHLPNKNEEEGIYAATVFLDGNNFICYYGAMDAGNPAGFVGGVAQLVAHPLNVLFNQSRAVYLLSP